MSPPCEDGPMIIRTWQAALGRWVLVFLAALVAVLAPVFGVVDASAATSAAVTQTTTTWEYDGFTPIAQTRNSRPTPDRNDLGAWPQPQVDAEFAAIITDLVGTPISLLDEEGQATWTNQPNTWGATEADPGMPLRFAGQYHDVESGLNYNFQRYYDPNTGRYITQDPLGLVPSPNPATYVPNPTTATDPLGLAACKPLIIGENMSRVKSYAKMVGAHSYQPWTNNPFNFALGMRRNERMIRDAMRKGCEIIDIGPDFARRSAGREPSPFDGMERRVTDGYANYRRVFERWDASSGGVPGLDF